MALDFSSYSEENLQAILKEFKIEAKVYSFNSLTAGYINDTFLVMNQGTPLYILQRVNHEVFVNIEGLMTNVTSALKQLKSSHYSQISLVAASTGKSYAKLDASYWRLMTYIPNSTTFNTTTDTDIAFEAGRIIGRFHSLLGREIPANYKETIPKFHELELRKMQFLAALARATNTKKKIANDATNFVTVMLEKLATMGTAEPPQRICHNDTKLNNILFSKANKKALCLIDLDTIMPGYFHYDFGDAVRTIVNTAPEDEQNHSKITFEEKLFEAFVNGLAANDAFLSSEETKALPYGVILMPFLHGIRALTDYLNNNVYYKVSYENQNLDRALSLFNFTKKALAKLDYMETVISRHLPQSN